MVSIHLNGKRHKFMSEIEPEISNNITDDIKRKNLIREENIKKETAHVKKIVDLILKTPKQNPEKLKAGKVEEKSKLPNKKK